MVDAGPPKADDSKAASACRTVPALRPGKGKIDAAAHRIEGESLAGLPHARNKGLPKRGDDAPKKLAASLRSRWRRRQIIQPIKQA